MKLTETLNIFVEHRPYKKNGESKIFHKITTSISTKQKSGDYLRMPVDIVVNDKKYPEAVLAKLDEKFMYKVNVINGWLMVDSYVNKDGDTIKKLVIYIDEWKSISKTPIDQEKRSKALESAKGNEGEQNTGLPF